VIKRVVPNFTFIEAPLGKDPDQRNYIVSNSKIENLGFKPTVSLYSGLEELAKGLPLFLSRPFTNL
jgi:nucleoside-diphosphate-sugar epimerase